MIHFFASFFWNPSRDAFIVPVIDRPVTWYGICFVIGFTLGYFVMVPIFQHYLARHPTKPISPSLSTPKQISYFLTDRLCWFVVIGTLVGARLGAVFFYDWDYYSQHPIEILKTWKGGLASHGGAIGVILALYAYLRYIRRWLPSITFLELLDQLSVPTALAVCFIRIGNFINQEILGTPTLLPWGVVFQNPIDGSLPVARHPVQLYEGIAYFATFIILYTLWKRKSDSLPQGSLIGLFFILVFTSRFILEFWKVSQESSLGDFGIQMGQLLSLPFIISGIFILIFSKKSCSNYRFK